MPAMSRRLLPLLLLFASLSAGAAPPLQLWFDAGWPPMSAVRAGKVEGRYVRLAEALMQRLHQPYQAIGLPWTRVLERLRAGQGCVVGAYRTDGRGIDLRFSQEPLFEEPVALFLAPGLPKRIQGLADLKGESLGVVRGWSYGEQADAALARLNLPLEPAPFEESLVLRMVSGRLHAMLGIETSTRWLMRKHGLQARIIPMPERNPTFIACPESGGHQEFLAQIDVALRELRGSPQWAELARTDPEP